MEKRRLSWPEVEQRAKRVVAEQLGINEQDVQLNSNFFDDLGADSLDTIEILLGMEEEFEIEIDDDLAEKMTTLARGFELLMAERPRDFLNVVESKALSFRLRSDGSIEVVLQLEDGSWTFADGHTQLPSMLCLVTISRWGPILKDLEALINDPKAKEQDLQEFFEKYPELVAGDEYDRIIPQATIAKDDGAPWRADFVLTPINQTEFCKVLELKLPNVELTTKARRGHITFSAKIWSAISQLKDYARAFESLAVRERFKSKYEADIYKPELHLIAGRTWDLQWINRIRDLRSSEQVSIENWDAVLERLRRRYT